MNQILNTNIDNYPIFVTELPKPMNKKELKKLLLNIDDEFIKEKLITENLWFVKKLL